MKTPTWDVVLLLFLFFSFFPHSSFIPSLLCFLSLCCKANAVNSLNINSYYIQVLNVCMLVGHLKWVYYIQILEYILYIFMFVVVSRANQRTYFYIQPRHMLILCRFNKVYFILVGNKSCGKIWLVIYKNFSPVYLSSLELRYFPRKVKRFCS